MLFNQTSEEIVFHQTLGFKHPTQVGAPLSRYHCGDERRTAIRGNDDRRPFRRRLFDDGYESRSRAAERYRGVNSKKVASSRPARLHDKAACPIFLPARRTSQPYLLKVDVWVVRGQLLDTADLVRG